MYTVYMPTNFLWFFKMLKKTLLLRIEHIVYMLIQTYFGYRYDNNIISSHHSSNFGSWFYFKLYSKEFQRSARM